MKRIALAGSSVVITAILIVGCSLFGEGEGGMNTTEGDLQAAYREPREITGQEALELYGIATEDPTTLQPTSTPLYFFPARAWVLPNEMPYDPNETITILPMFTRPSLNDGGTWLGDLEAGTEIVLQGVDAERNSCLVEGVTLQGWSTLGWVACNRLRFDAGE